MIDNHSRPCIEMEIGKSRKVFLKIFFDPDEIWVDTHGLGQSAEFCALIDCTPILMAKCGVRQKTRRTFVNINWAIDEWGGPKDLVEALKKRREITLKQMPELKKKLLNDN